MRRIVDLLGWVRFIVSLVTVGTVAAALVVADVNIILTGAAVALLALALVKAPFGAKYRRW